MSMHDADIALAAPQVDATPLATVRGGVMRDYYELTKPGISQMVAMTTLAGYYLALPGELSVQIMSAPAWLQFLMTMGGTLAVSSGSCVVNHIMERNEDARMKRTATRPIPAGRISVAQATTFGAVLTIVGLGMLMATNWLTVTLAVITWLSYVVVYTPLKKHSTVALLVGGVPGALPFAGGWTAVRGSMDIEAWALFAILFFWQLPHFLALSWMYRADYRAGGFVMHAVEDPDGRHVGMQMVITSVLTLASIVTPVMLGMTGWLYGAGAVLGGLWLTAESIRFVRVRETSAARRVLLTSYAVLMGVVFLMFLDKI